MIQKNLQKTSKEGREKKSKNRERGRFSSIFWFIFRTRASVCSVGAAVNRSCVIASSSGGSCVITSSSGGSCVITSSSSGCCWGNCSGGWEGTASIRACWESSGSGCSCGRRVVHGSSPQGSHAGSKKNNSHLHFSLSLSFSSFSFTGPL